MLANDFMRKTDLFRVFSIISFSTSLLLSFDLNTSNLVSRINWIHISAFQGLNLFFPLFADWREARRKYTRSKSPNIQSRMSIEVSNPISAIPAIPTNRQRARTGSMPAENRKVRDTYIKHVIYYILLVVLAEYPKLN